MPSLDWGSVPAWLASVLTGGSLLLGLSIVNRDHKNREREQVAQVGFWVTPTPRMEEQGFRIAVRIFNSSKLPVSDIDVTVIQQVWYFSETEYAWAKLRLDFDIGGLRPEETKKYWKQLLPWRRSPDGAFESDNPLLMALDKDGVHWGTELLAYRVGHLPPAEDEYQDGPFMRGSQIAVVIEGMEEHGYGTLYRTNDEQVDIGWAEPDMSMTLTDNVGRVWEIVPGKSPIKLKRTRWNVFRFRRRRHSTKDGEGR